MSSRKDAKNWMTFCKHMREAIIDEQKAVPDYAKLIREGKQVITDKYTLGMLTHTVNKIKEQEEQHRNSLLILFDQTCPRMAVHRKGVK